MGKTKGFTKVMGGGVKTEKTINWAALLLGRY